ncbi:MAG: MFS transporter [Alphaproteobacteria bacterium]
MPARVAIAFFLFALLFGIGQFHRVSLAVIAGDLQTDLGLGGNLLGIFGATFFLAGAAAQIPTGILLDRLGPRRTVPLILLVGIAGALVLAAASDASQAIVGRALAGFGAAASVMGAYVVFARWLPPERFATVASLMIAFGSIGGLVATTPLALLLEHVTWRTVFVGLAVLTAGLATCVLLLVRDTPPGLPVAKAPASLRDSLRGLIEVFRVPAFWPIAAAGFVQFGPVTALYGLWAGPYLHDVHGLSLVERGHVLMAMAIASPLALTFVGPLDRVFNTRKWLIVAVMLGEAVVMVGLGGFGERGWLVAACGLVLANCLATHYVVLAAHVRAVMPDYLIGRANTVVNMIAALGVAFAQMATGAIIDILPGAGGAIGSVEAYRWIFWFLAALLVCATVGYLPVRDAPPRPISSRDET